MLSEDQYFERTPDLIAKIRRMREAAEKEMNRFTSVDDYDVRRVVSHGLKPAPRASEGLPSSSPGDGPKTFAAESVSTEHSIESPAHADDGGKA